MHVIGTAGHVDHGKSTLVQALTGMDPDRFEEEKRRGLTIDLGFAWFTLPSGRECGVVDVPGHERFIRNMLAGVGAVDAALFVVAADEGWMPQSAEHLQILDFLRVRTGVVALTKVDLVDAELAALAADEVSRRLEGTALEGAPVVGVSAVSGEGLDALREALDEVLEDVGPTPDHGRPRLFVDRSFTITGAGTIVTGTLTGGRLVVGEEVELLPEGRRARVRGLQTHREPVEEAVPGSRVAANLVGLDRQEVRRGDAVVRAGQWKLSDTFAARVQAARDLAHPLAERGAYELYVGTAEVPCRLKFLEDPPPHPGRLPVLPPGESLLVQIFSMRPVPLEPGDRFVVRDVGRWETVAGGVVLDQVVGRTRRGDPEILERLRAREQAAGEDLLVQLLSERGSLVRAEAGPLTGLGPDELEHALARAVAAGRVVATAGHLFDPARAAELRSQATAALKTHHAGRPLEPGMPREGLRSKLGLDARPFSELLETWGPDILAEGAVVRLASHGAALSPEEEAAAARALEALRSAGASPPDPGELGLAPALLKALERRGDVAIVTPQIVYAADVMADIERKVVSLIEKTGGVAVADVRDAIGTTRKYAVPLLEHLDSTGLTVRQGDVRVLGPRGRRLAGG